MNKLGKQNQKFTNTSAEGQRFSNRRDVVSSDEGFFRYAKRTNAKGGHKLGQFSLRPENRDASGIRSNQFSSKRRGRRAVGYKRKRYQNRAD